jgi:hypothetical protein
MSHRAALVAGSLALALALAPPAPATAAQGSGPSDWRPFEGSWSASGRREAVPVEGGAEAVVVELRGPVAVMRGDGLGRGFHGQAIGFDDGQGLVLGRAVWTDEHGDRIFSRLKGEPLGTGRRIEGTITGGTGRYEGLEGEYSFTWQYVVAAEDGAIQGRAVRLEGRVRRKGTTP